MPIYEYVCRKCGEQFVWLTREGEEPSCPSCGTRRLARQLSVPFAHKAGPGASCPAREAGACGVDNCRGGSCGLGDWT